LQEIPSFHKNANISQAHSAIAIETAAAAAAAADRVGIQGKNCTTSSYRSGNRKDLVWVRNIRRHMN
jgi:hypothetical protein